MTNSHSHSHSHNLSFFLCCPQEFSTVYPQELPYYCAHITTDLVHPAILPYCSSFVNCIQQKYPVFWWIKLSLEALALELDTLEASFRWEFFDTTSPIQFSIEWATSVYFTGSSQVGFFQKILEKFNYYLIILLSKKLHKFLPNCI